jgi:hypothetical protein
VLNVVKITTVRLAQRFFAGRLEHDDFVILAAALKLYFQIQASFSRHEPLIVRKPFQADYATGAAIILD